MKIILAFVGILFASIFLSTETFAQGMDFHKYYRTIPDEIGGLYIAKGSQSVNMLQLQYLQVGRCSDKQILTFQDSNSTWICTEDARHENEPTSYLIYQSGNTIYAKSVKPGLVDFSGTDAKTVMQNAINALTEGGKVFLNNGTYIMSGKLLLRSNIDLEGESWSTILKLGDHIDTNVIDTDLSGISNLVVRNIQIDGNKANQDAPHYPDSNRIGIELLQTIDTTINHVYVHDTDGMGISFSATGNKAEHHWLVNSYVKNPNGDCYYFGGTKSVLSNSMCEGHRDYGIVIARCKFCVVTNSTTIGDVSSSSKNRNGIYGNGMGTDRSTNNTAIIGNTIINSPHFGIGGSNIGPPDMYSGSNVLIADNEIRNATLDGIHITKGDRYIIANNAIIESGGYGIDINLNDTQIIGNQVAHSARGGVTLTNSNNTFIGFNIVKNNGWSKPNNWDGISINGIKGKNIQIMNNVVYDDQITKTQRYGINNEGSCDYCFATHNTVYGLISGKIHGTLANTILNDIKPTSGFVKADQNQLLKSRIPTILNIYGKVNNPQGGKVVLYITRPDDVIDQNVAYVTSSGDFFSPMVFDGNSLTGRYEIDALYQNSNLGSVLLNVTSSQVLVVNETNPDIGIIIPSGHDKTLSPWLKTVAKLWSAGQISDNIFGESIQYLVKVGIIEKLQENQTLLHQSTHIPTWFKNNASWWADGQIADGDFNLGVQYLLGSGIMRISS